MQRKRPTLTVQILAAGVTFTAVLIMLTPLRRGPAEMPSRQAGWVPLLNLGGLADTSAFHRLEISPTRQQASERPMIRAAAVGKPVNSHE